MRSKDHPITDVLWALPAETGGIGVGGGRPHSDACDRSDWLLASSHNNAGIPSRMLDLRGPARLRLHRDGTVRSAIMVILIGVLS